MRRVWGISNGRHGSFHSEGLTMKCHRVIVFVLTAVITLCSEAGCVGGGQPTPPQPGFYGYLSDQDYQPPLQPLDSGAKDGWVAQWQTTNWSEGFTKIDPSAEDFVNHPWTDVMLVSAHGDWHPTLGMIPDDWTMQPINNERWLYIFACDSLSPVRDANDQIEHDQNGNVIPNTAWNTAFGYSLHGVYGFWDPYSGTYQQNYTLAHSIAKNSWVGSSNTGGYPTAFTAYQDANEDSALLWAVIDGVNSHNDSVSSVPDSYVVNGDSINDIGSLQLWLGNLGLVQSIPIPSLSLGSAAPTYTLVPENIDENQWITQYQDSSTVVVHEPGITTVYQVGGAAIHYQNSGGIKYETNATGTTQGLTPSSAIAEADSFIQQNGGMPTDATLRRELEDVVMPMDDSSPPTITSYTIEYGHTAAIAGYDGIKVKVDDAGYNLCTLWGWRRSPDPPFKNIKYCKQYTWQTVPHVSYYYRLWRSLGLASGAAETLAFTVPSTTVLAQLSGSHSITRQGFAYYTPPMEYNAATDQIATPVQFYDIDSFGRLDYAINQTFMGFGGQQ